MVGTLLLGLKSCIWDTSFKTYDVSKSIPAAKFQNFVGKKSTWVKLLEFDFFLSETTRLYRYYQSKYQLRVTSSSYTNLTMKLLVKLYLWTQKQGKSEILMFFGKLCISHFLWHNFPYFSSLNLIIRTR